MGMYVEGQVVVRGVNLFDQFVQFVMVIVYYVQYWVEDFFFQFVEVVEFDKCWWYEGFVMLFVGVFVIFMYCLVDGVVFGVYCLNMVFDIFFCFCIDNWIDIGGQVFWIVYLVFVYGVVQYG